MVAQALNDNSNAVNIINLFALKPGQSGFLVGSFLMGLVGDEDVLSQPEHRRQRFEQGVKESDDRGHLAGGFGLTSLTDPAQSSAYRIHFTNVLRSATSSLAGLI